MVGSLLGSSSPPNALASSALYRQTDLSRLAFETTDELQPVESLVGQARALEAVTLGTKTEKKGFNLFVTGPSSVAVRDSLKTLLAGDARRRPEPVRLGLCQQFRQARPSQGDRTAVGARGRLQGGDAQADRGFAERGACRLPERGLSDAARIDRRSVPEEAVRGLQPIAGKRGGEEHRVVAHARGLRAGSRRQRRSRAARRIQRLAAGQTRPDAGRHRGARKGPGTYRAPDPANGKAAARRNPGAEPRHRGIRGRPSDSGGEGRFQRHSRESPPTSISCAPT